ncbi:MAG: APC family permease [Firmicutes bacterium]|nr:APC family permease [Bacillota bacterium]
MAAQQMKKELSFLDLTMASLGAIIGSGWLLAGQAAAVGAGPSALLSWLIAGVVIMFIGLVYAELGAMFPEAGGIVRYPQYSHGHMVSFIIGWSAWIAYSALPAVESEAVVTYAQSYVPAFSGPHGTISAAGLGVAAGLMVLFFIINYFGVRTFARINTTVTFLKFIMPSLTIVIFLIFGMHWSNFHSHGFMPDGTAGMMKVVSTAGVVFSYLGFRQAIDLSGEAKNPQKDVPRAIIFSLILGILIYTLLQFVFLGAVQPQDLIHGWSGLNYSAPFAQLAIAMNLSWFGMFIFADAILSPSGTGNIYIATLSRLLYALAKNRYFPRALLYIDPKTGVPLVALATGVLVGLAFLAPFPAWQALVAVASSAAVLTYISGPVSSAALRRLAPDIHRPVRTAALSVLGPLAFIGGSLIIYWTGWNTDKPLLGLILVGIVLYGLFSWLMPGQIEHPSRDALKASAWFIVYLLFMLAMSYYGSGVFGAPANHGRGFIPYPYDLFVLALASLGFYFWGVHSAYMTPDLKEKLAQPASSSSQSA